MVTFDLTIGDDFGVKRVGLEWVGSENGEDGKTPMRGEKVTAAGGNEKKEMSVGATFCATREGVPPQTVEVRAWAEDYLPDRKRSHSASFVLQVLNKTDHALWLTQQVGRWLEVAKESYEREQQLHQMNKELRALAAEELDRPENRRRVSQQAAAENANASRLDALNSAGRRLVEQATKNDEFDAKRLSRATMLQSLKDTRPIGCRAFLICLQSASAATVNSRMRNRASGGFFESAESKPGEGEAVEGPRRSAKRAATWRRRRRLIPTPGEARGPEHSGQRWATDAPGTACRSGTRLLPPSAGSACRQPRLQPRRIKSPTTRAAAITGAREDGHRHRPAATFSRSLRKSPIN